MEIIPVIDVRHGVAVRAVAGDRANYKPLVTPLAATADPVDVALGYRALFAFSTIYLADLDGIEGRGANPEIVQRLIHGVPGSTFWIDNGSAKHADIIPLLASTRLNVVIGSESLTSLDELEHLRCMFGARIILSLDFRGDEFLGPPRLLEGSRHWPDRIIVMTLARVGTDEGPDLVRLRDLIVRAGTRRVYIAGGVRKRRDLIAAREAGAAGALIASALHSGQIKTGDLEEIAGW